MVISMLCCSYRYTAAGDRTISSSLIRLRPQKGVFSARSRATWHEQHPCSQPRSECEVFVKNCGKRQHDSNHRLHRDRLPKGIQHQDVSGQCPRGQHTDDGVQLRTKRRQLVGDVRAEVSNVSTNRKLPSTLLAHSCKRHESRYSAPVRS
jgi:hypothetical protein